MNSFNAVFTHSLDANANYHLSPTLGLHMVDVETPRNTNYRANIGLCFWRRLLFDKLPGVGIKV